MDERVINDGKKGNARQARGASPSRASSAALKIVGVGHALRACAQLDHGQCSVPIHVFDDELNVVAAGTRPRSARGIGMRALGSRRMRRGRRFFSTSRGVFPSSDWCGRLNGGAALLRCLLEAGGRVFVDGDREGDHEQILAPRRVRGPHRDLRAR